MHRKEGPGQEARLEAGQTIAQKNKSRRKQKKTGAGNRRSGTGSKNAVGKGAEKQTLGAGGHRGAKTGKEGKTIHSRNSRGDRAGEENRKRRKSGKSGTHTQKQEAENGERNPEAGQRAAIGKKAGNNGSDGEKQMARLQNRKAQTRIGRDRETGKERASQGGGKQKRNKES